MFAIIVGGGKLGFSVAQLLNEEDYEVTVIEPVEDRCRILEDRLDVITIQGNGASISVLEEAGIDQASLLVAVAGSDEVNMVACMLAKQAGVARTVARVRNPEYLEDKNSGRNFLSGIDLIINPELVTAREIVKLIEVPEALDVMYCFDRKAMVLELPIPEGSSAAGRRIDQIKTEWPLLIVAIIRKKKVLIPRGSDRIMAGDTIYLLARTEEMANVERYLGLERRQTEKVMVLGGGRTGSHLAHILEDKNYAVRLLEKDYQKCEILSEKLRHTLVIHGDATDLDLLKQEGADQTDVFVSVTDDDKVNLLACLIAKHLGAKKAIAQVRRSDYIGLIQSVGIDVGVSPRILTTNAIMRFIKNNKNLLSVTFLREEEAGVMEFNVSENSRAAGKKLMDLYFPNGALVGSILRDGEVMIAKGRDRLQPGDVVTVFALNQVADKVIEFFD
ncbi:MAG: Trk system potassium transporter TrkA [Peptococcaceae bacterium]|nr:Trk system potassium transporter TrkA [Peptococcaceae bacterium]